MLFDKIRDHSGILQCSVFKGVSIHVRHEEDEKNIFSQIFLATSVYYGSLSPNYSSNATIFR